MAHAEVREDDDEGELERGCDEDRGVHREEDEDG